MSKNVFDIYIIDERCFLICFCQMKNHLIKSWISPKTLKYNEYLMLSEKKFLKKHNQTFLCYRFFPVIEFWGVMKINIILGVM